MGLRVNKLKKYAEFVSTKISLLVHQKQYTSNDVTYKYMLDKSDTDTLVIVFSSCTRKGLKARYNYVRTLKPINVNKLFILDDFASDSRGSYYIGENMKYNEEKAAVELINHIIEKLSIKKIICCGSSKGGWSALNFGLQIPNSFIISGGPQYFLGTYLQNSGNYDALEHITGGISDEKIHILDNHLKDKIYRDEYKETHKIYLHYSDKEHTYEEHIKYLISELKKNNYYLIEDVGNYVDHSEISLHFPDYLKKTINTILGDE